jgi:hypothetical protein
MRAYIFMAALIVFPAHSLLFLRKLVTWFPICVIQVVFWGAANTNVFAASGLDEPVTMEKNVENPTTAKFEALVGVITGPDGKPVVGAWVNPQSLDHPSNPVSDIGIITDAQGHYQWLLLPGRYSITVYREGFQRVTQTIVIEVGEPARLDFVLEPAL